MSIPDPREERDVYLAKAAGGSGSLPETTRTFEELYLRQIAQGGGGSGLPDVTIEDDGDILAVVSGVWAKADAPIGLIPRPSDYVIPAAENTGWYYKTLPVYLEDASATIREQTGRILNSYQHIDGNAYTLFNQLLQYLIIQAKANNNAVKMDIPSALLTSWNGIRSLIHKVRYGGVFVIEQENTTNSIIFNILHTPSGITGDYYVSVGVIETGSSADIVELNIKPDSCECFVRPYTLTSVPFPS